MKKWTTTRIKAAKGKAKIVALTAYDCGTARTLDQAGIQLVLIGDSLAMTVLGYEDTIPVTIDEMLHHAKAVVRGVEYAQVVADMPFLSFQVSEDQAIDNAGRFIKEAGVDSVKIEGGAHRAKTVEALVRNGIPVLGHIGLLPQSIREKGGYKIEGKTEETAKQLVDDGLALAEAGVYALVLEGIPTAVAAEVTARVPVPTIGIGAGPECDGQILVIHDVLGLTSGHQPKFVKRYAELGEAMADAVEAYKREVEEGEFPGPEHCY